MNIDDNYFDFSQSERKGLVVLAVLIVIALLVPVIFNLFKTKPTTDFTRFEAALTSLQTQNDSILAVSAPIPSQQITPFSFNPNTLSKDSLQRLGLPPTVVNNIVNYRNKGGRFFKAIDFKKIYGLEDEVYQQLANYIDIPQRQAYKKTTDYQKPEKETPIKVQALTPFPFNPNTINESKLMQLGLSEKVVNTIINFRNKGGQFYKKEDLQKIYGLTPSVYQQLADYIQLEQAKNKNTLPVKTQNAKPKVASITIDINSATMSEWQQLRGIGSFYAKNITKYRDQLGGFISIDQIKETYRLPDSTFQQIKPHLKLTTAAVTKTNINTSDWKALVKHPYLNSNQANVIIKYRKQHGPFEKIEDLKRTDLIDDELIAKLNPYLSL